MIEVRIFFITLANFAAYSVRSEREELSFYLTPKKHLLNALILKVVINEKQGGSGRCQMKDIESRNGKLNEKLSKRNLWY